MLYSIIDIFIKLHPRKKRKDERLFINGVNGWETLDALKSLVAPTEPTEDEGKRVRGERGKEKARKDGRERAKYMYIRERTDIMFQIGIRGIGLLGSK